MYINIVHGDHGVSPILLKQTIELIMFDPASEGKTLIEFNEIIGYNHLIEVSDKDKFYEKRRGSRPYKSRFVRNRKPIPTNKLAVIWTKDSKRFKVITAYFTNSSVECPDEPGNVIRKYKSGSKKVTLQTIQESLDFWSKHAFVE